MDQRKIFKLTEYLIYVYLILFPFGQLLRIPVKFSNYEFALHPIDLVAFTQAAVILINFEVVKKDPLYRYFQPFLLTVSFSLLLSFSYFKFSQVFFGSFYFIRFIAYLILSFSVRNLVSQKPRFKKFLFDSLILVSFLIALFGWFQYFFYPDLTLLKDIGWDDHFGRLVGTFLDPGFTGLILVFGFLLILSKLLKLRKISMVPLAIFLFLSVTFTYSRASLLALLVSVSYLFVKKKKYLYILVLFLLLLLTSLFLPRSKGEGVRLERVSSINLRVKNYEETLRIFGKHPLFGVGFNNLCALKLRGQNISLLKYHSCSGSDSSILLILTTTGVVGFIIFLSSIWKIFKILPKSRVATALLACFVALIVHSLFVNSLFYPWVMGYLAILTGVTFSLPSGSKLKR